MFRVLLETSVWHSICEQRHHHDTASSNEMSKTHVGFDAGPLAISSYLEGRAPCSLSYGAYSPWTSPIPKVHMANVIIITISKWHTSRVDFRFMPSLLIKVSACSAQSSNFGLYQNRYTQQSRNFLYTPRMLIFLKWRKQLMSFKRHINRHSNILLECSYNNIRMKWKTR